MTLIKPHGGDLVGRVLTGEPRQALIDSLERSPSLTLKPWEVADFEMIATGALSPLRGFMGLADYKSTLRDMRLADGLPWTIPVTLRVEERLRADRFALRNSDGVLLGIIEVSDVFKGDRAEEARAIYRTEDTNHPGVRRLLDSGGYVVGGKIWLVDRVHPAFPELALDPGDTRAAFAKREWRTIVGFQTRNPVHRAHEYIQKAALETVDGLLLHPLVGETKDDDIPASIRVRSYRALLDNYYPEGRVLLAAFPAAMRYAGPREAVFHAIARKNYGCSHFIVGRDHAGVGSYYGSYDAQKIFDRFIPEELGIKPIFFEHSFFCRACNGMASQKTCPHGTDSHIALSGTHVRELLRAGEFPPPEFSRPEVAKVLIEGLRWNDA
ncbi:MAG TPA: sulfate adenylyltransferase [Gemmatimonadaceae bacterium]|nr:sulfate adenylyltransferase [Gemmatimonadaceae bacterium]